MIKKMIEQAVKKADNERNELKSELQTMQKHNDDFRKFVTSVQKECVRYAQQEGYPFIELKI